MKVVSMNKGKVTVELDDAEIRMVRAGLLDRASSFGDRSYSETMAGRYGKAKSFRDLGTDYRAMSREWADLGSNLRESMRNG